MGMRGVGWIVLSVVAGLAIGGLAYYVPHSSLSGQLVVLGILVGLTVLLAGVPWLAFRPSWLWWVATVVGLVVGFFAGAFVVGTLLNQALFCIFGNCPPPNPYANALLLAIPLAVMGVAEVLTLHGGARRIGWLVTALVAALMLPYGLIFAARLLGQDVNNPGLVAFLIAGAAWGVVVGVGLTALTARRAT